MVRRFSSSLDWSLQSFFFSPRCFSLGSRTRNSAYMELRLFLCSGALRRILSSALWIGISLQIYLASVIVYVQGKILTNLMISGSEAVVFFLASGSEDHEQEFNHHWRILCHYPQLLCAHLSLFRIICVTFLLGTVIELDRLHIYAEQCPFLLLAFNMDLLQLP